MPHSTAECIKKIKDLCTEHQLKLHQSDPDYAEKIEILTALQDINAPHQVVDILKTPSSNDPSITQRDVLEKEYRFYASSFRKSLLTTIWHPLMHLLYRTKSNERIFMEQLRQGPAKEQAQYHWNLLRTWVRSGIVTPGLHETITRAEKQGVNLITPVPVKAMSIDPIAYRQYRDKLQPNYQTYADLLLSKLDHMSFAQLIEHLKNMAKKINAQVALEPHKKVFLLTHSNKSDTWIATLIYRFLDFEPTAVIDMHALSILKFKSYGPFLTPLDAFPNDEFLLLSFDDGSYSGLQLTERINTIRDLFGQRNKRNTYPIKVVFSYVMMTNQAIEKASQHIDTLHPAKNIEINICYEKKILIVQEMDWGDCNDTFDTSIGRIAFGDSSTAMDCLNKVSTVYTDWKIPDNYSTIHHFFKGHISKQISLTGKAIASQAFLDTENEQCPYKKSWRLTVHTQ